MAYQATEDLLTELVLRCLTLPGFDAYGKYGFACQLAANEPAVLEELEEARVKLEAKYRGIPLYVLQEFSMMGNGLDCYFYLPGANICGGDKATIGQLRMDLAKFNEEVHSGVRKLTSRI